MQLSRYEQETIFNYNEAEKTASVFTHNAALRRKLERLAEERPQDCRRIRTTQDGQGVTYEIPKAWIKITPTRILSEAQKEQLRQARERQKLA